VALGLAVLVLGGVALFLGLSGGSGSPHSSTATKRPWLWSKSPIRRGPLIVRRGHAPPQPLDRRGIPALLSSDPAVKNAYLAQLARSQPTPKPPTNVGFFGHVVNVSGGQLTVRREPFSVSDLGSGPASAKSWVQAPVLRVSTSRRTALLLGRGGLGSLHNGSEVFVGGRRSGRNFDAQLLADPVQMQKPRGAGGATTTTASATPPTMQPTSPGPHYRLVSDVSTATTASPPTGTSSAQPTTSSTSSVPEDLSGSEPDTVELHDQTAVLGGKKVPAFVFDPHFDATIGSPDNCEIGVHAELLIANDYELHWPFQFVREGTGFGVVSLDREDPGFTAGPVHGDVGFTDPSKYTVYSGFGGSAQLYAGVSCHVNVPFGQVGVNFGLGTGNISLAWVNKTLHHARLTGDPDGDLEVPPDQCGGGAVTLGPVQLGVQDCQYQSLGAGLFRATLTGQGGTPQGIAVSYPHGDSVHYATAPQGGPIRVDQFNYAAALKTHMVLGLLVNINAAHFLPSKSRPRVTAAQKKAGVFTSAERHPNQRGPTLPDGRWRNTHNKWHDADDNTVDAPSDAEVGAANANWIHENQVGPTYSNGAWQHREKSQWLDPFGRSYTWRDAQSKVLSGPPAQATPNELTNTSPADQEPLETPDDLHGWTYETEEGDSISPASADPSPLFLNLPIEAAPPTPPPPTISSCVIPHGAEGGADLPYTAKGLTCAQALQVVEAAKLTVAKCGASPAGCGVQGFTCRLVTQPPVQPGSRIVCALAAKEIDFEEPG
jgi:hypothetical protein